MGTLSQYVEFYEMDLDELKEQEKAALSFLNSSSEILAKDAQTALRVIRDAMKIKHNYNWLTRQMRKAV